METRERRDVRASLRKPFCTYPLVALSVLLALLFIRPALSEYFVSTSRELDEQSILRASRILDEQAPYHYLLGLMYSDRGDTPGIEKAIHQYHLALKRNPVNARTWLAIAKAYRERGMHEHARYAIKRAVLINRNSPYLIWEAAVFFLLEDNLDEATRLYKKYLSLNPDDQESVYSLYYVMHADPGHIITALLPWDYSFYKRYFRFLLSKHRFKESWDLWETMQSFTPERSLYLEYVNFLINADEIKEALQVWNDFVQRFTAHTTVTTSHDRLWNGDFELPLEDGGFDWRLGEADGVSVFPDMNIKRTGYASLSIRFQGTHNPGITIARQTVSVQPATQYKVIGYIRTDNITTKNGLYLEASGFKCHPFVNRTESVTGTIHWQRMELDFRTPSECSTVTIAIGRERSEKFDNKINGDAWIDSLTMTAQQN